MSKLSGRYSLLTSTNATGTNTSYNTYNSRKFSDYRFLIFYLYTSASSTTLIRDVKIIPSGMWASGKQLALQAAHGGSLENFSGITLSYDSDTAIKAVTQGAGSLTGFSIDGWQPV